MPETPRCSIAFTRPSQSFHSPTTETFVAFGAHTANVDSLVGDVRAELLVQLLVPALADQVQVDLAEARRHAFAVASSIRRMPATGMCTHSGRLFSS